MSQRASPRQGPLVGLKGVLLGGIGPAPYAAMLMADLGADITRVERPGPVAEAANPLHPKVDLFARGQAVIRADLATECGRTQVWGLLEEADFLLEGFRPGVLERMGFVPERCHQRNPGLVIVRITGWGQQGPLAKAPGHDINYLALAGALSLMPKRAGSEGRAIPLNLIADFAGGGLWACFGLLSAIHERSRSGRGQVVDAAMVDGVMSLMGMAYALRGSGGLAARPAESLLDGGAHFYDTYPCADGQEVAVGAVEPQFYADLCRLCGLEEPEPGMRFEAGRWSGLKERLATKLSTRERDEWCAGNDAQAACVTPVLALEEAMRHPHHLARNGFMQGESMTVPAPGPRFSRTPAGLPVGYEFLGDHQ